MTEMYESKSLVALVKAYGRHQYTLGQLSMINTPTGKACSTLGGLVETTMKADKDLAEIHEEGHITQLEEVLRRYQTYLDNRRDYPFREIAIKERQLSKDILSEIFQKATINK